MMGALRVVVAFAFVGLAAGGACSSNGGSDNSGSGGSGAPIVDLPCVQALYDQCGAFGACQYSVTDNAQHLCFAGGTTAEVATSGSCNGTTGEMRTTVTVRKASGSLCFTFETVCACSSACELRQVTWKNAAGTVVAMGQTGAGFGAQCELGPGAQCGGGGNPSGDNSCVPVWPPADCTPGSCP